MFGTFLTTLFSRTSSQGQGGREARYQQVMQEFGASLLRVGAVYGFKGPDLEEMEQEIALAVWEALPKWTSDSSLRTYLFRVAHNTSIDALRRKGRQLPHSDAEADLQASTGGSPERQAIERQALRELQRAVEALPLLHRQVITLWMEGVSAEEIGQILGIKDSYVHVLVHRVRAVLKAELEGL